ncbi:hypothetical protein [Photobacterium sp. NCIMB 13483]|uniref:hypothetical protein n=1 Tax=Photobacterium sp. NCIMB 13483 TaxID=2022103 RepID=UPI001304DBE3|nr:hypothetical protein [Photobacterium sp. NCIMB 13483]
MIILLVLFIISALTLVISLRLCRFNDSPNEQSVNTTPASPPPILEQKQQISEKLL